jgi:hypothetical protein
VKKLTEPAAERIPLAARAPAASPAAAPARGRLRVKKRSRSLWRLAGRHRTLTVLVVIGAALRAVVEIAYPPALEFHGDTYTYLANASHLVPRLDRPIAYPALLKLLSVTHSLFAVTVLQHALGLALGVGIYALVRRVGAPAWLAAVAAAPILLDGYQLDIEQFVLSETLFEVLVFLAFALLIWKVRPAARTCAVIGLVLAAATLTRSVGAILVGPVLLYLLVLRVGVRRIAALLAAFVIPLVGYAGWFDSAHGQFSLVGYSGIFLYGEVAPIADCKGLSLPSYERILCDPTPAAIRLGPNYYDWISSSPRFWLNPPLGVTVDGALSDFSRRVILHQPLAYAREVTGETLHYFAPGRFVGPRDWYLATWRFPTDDPQYATLWHTNPADRTFGLEVYVSHPRWALTPWLRGYQDVVYTPGPLLALAALLGLVAVFRRRRGADSAAVRWGAFCLSAAGIALLVVPSATATFDYRYLLPDLVVLPLAGALGWRVLFPRRA